VKVLLSDLMKVIGNDTRLIFQPWKLIQIFWKRFMFYQKTGLHFFSRFFKKWTLISK